jgi:molecular chaperone DnaJ
MRVWFVFGYLLECYALKRDPYDILGVEKGAETSAVKKAYFGLAKKYHPDTCKVKHRVDAESRLDWLFVKEPGAKERFLEIQEAYEVLSDPQKKEHIDRHGFSAGVDGDGGAENGNSHGCRVRAVIFLDRLSRWRGCTNECEWYF